MAEYYLDEFNVEGSDRLRSNLKSKFTARFNPDKKRWYVGKYSNIAGANELIRLFNNGEYNNTKDSYANNAPSKLNTSNEAFIASQKTKRANAKTKANLESFLKEIAKTVDVRIVVTPDGAIRSLLRRNDTEIRVLFSQRDYSLFTFKDLSFERIREIFKNNKDTGAIFSETFSVEPKEESDLKIDATALHRLKKLKISQKNLAIASVCSLVTTFTNDISVCNDGFFEYDENGFFVEWKWKEYDKKMLLSKFFDDSHFDDSDDKEQMFLSVATFAIQQFINRHIYR